MTRNLVTLFTVLLAVLFAIPPIAWVWVQWVNYWGAR